MQDDDELVTIDRFLSIADAEIARATLEAAAIDAVLVDENIVRISWGDAQAHGGVRLQVRRRDAIEAGAVLRAEHLRAVDAVDETYESAPTLSRDEACRRCGSEEIFPTESRARTFARAILLSWAGVVLLNLGRCGAAMAGYDAPPALMNGAIALALLTPFAAFIWIAVAPKKRCRNCGLEWRGTPRTN